MPRENTRKRRVLQGKSEGDLELKLEIGAYVIVGVPVLAILSGVRSEVGGSWSACSRNLP
jgi:hypothetical protein